MYSGIQAGDKLYHYECFFHTGKKPRVDVCTYLKEKLMTLVGEIKREPERAKKRMAETEEKIRRYRDRIFDEQGRLIDPEGLKRALENQIKISEENAKIILTKIGTILEIAEEIKCPNAAEMRRIHDLEAFPVLTSDFPKIWREVAERLEKAW